MNTIQSIDFSQPRDILQRQVNDAFANIGFMLAHNIGIDADLLERVYQASHTFFARTQAQKDAYVYRSAAENFGYQGMQQENLDPTAPADLKETFTMRNIMNRPLADERWPDPAFRDLMIAFYANVFDASRTLQTLLAEILELPDDFFVRCHNGENSTLRLLYYPASGVEHIEAGQLGAGAHTDYGMLTFLFQDNVGGLQVQGLDGAWIDVSTEPGSVVINCGDLLERWTNGRYKSTLHRVQPKIGERSRLSIAMFLDPDSDTLVDAIPSCVSADHPARFPPVSAGEHVQQMLDASQKQRYTT